MNLIYAVLAFSLLGVFVGLAAYLGFQVWSGERQKRSAPPCGPAPGMAGGGPARAGR